MTVPSKTASAPTSAPKATSWPPSLDALSKQVANQWAKTPTIPRPLTTGERGWISSRCAEIAPHALAQHDRRSCMMEVARMLSALASGPMTEAQAEAKADAYAEALDGVPTWAVVAARRDWYRGEVEGVGNVNLAFAPSPGQMSILAQRHHHAIRAEFHRLQRLLDAKPVEQKPANPEMVKRLSSMLTPIGRRVE